MSVCQSRRCVGPNLDAVVWAATRYMEAHNWLGSLLVWGLLQVHLILPFCSRNSLQLHIVICMTLLTFSSFFSCVCVFSCVWAHVWGHICADWGWLQEFPPFPLFIWTGYPTEPSAHDHGSFPIPFALKILCLLSIGMTGWPLAYLAVTLFGDLNVRLHACLESTLTPELSPRPQWLFM